VVPWYRKKHRHYKYETIKRVDLQTDWRLPEDVYTRRNFVVFTMDGYLTINSGYAWDGPSGPTFDTPSTMRASLVHDAIYQLIREHRLGMWWREPADKLLGRIMLEDYVGVWPRWHAARVRAWVWALKKFGWVAARPEHL
jgi:hypothetical protein